MRTGGLSFAMLLCALLAVFPVAPVEASGFAPVYLAESHAEPDRIDPDGAAEIVRRATGGRVLAVERRGNGRPWFRVKVLIDGQQIRYVAVDGRSGRIRR